MKTRILKRAQTIKETLYISMLYHVQNGKYGVSVEQEVYVDFMKILMDKVLDLLMEGYTFELPMRLGSLQIDKVETKFSFNERGIRKDATTYPVDPVATRANIEKGINKLVYDTSREFMYKMRWYKGEFTNRRAYYLEVNDKLGTFLYKQAE
jgi:hypothetical protein